MALPQKSLTRRDAELDSFIEHNMLNTSSNSV